MPRPTDGFVQAAASAIVSIPVTTGTPSTTKWRLRSTAPDIVAMSLIGSPSSHWAWSGNDPPDPLEDLRLAHGAQRRRRPPTV